MELLVLENSAKIRKNKLKLEKELNVKISLRGKSAEISGDEIEEYLASRIIEAISFGFPVEKALFLKDEGHMFEKLSLKPHGEKKRLEQIRARIIGKHGRTREILEELADCFIVVHCNYFEYSFTDRWSEWWRPRYGNCGINCGNNL